MSTTYERYKKRLSGNAHSIRQAREKQSTDINNRAFEYADGYQLGQVFTRLMPDSNIHEWQDYDFLIKHTLVEQEKKVIIRPNTDLKIGSYIKYNAWTDNETGETRDVTLIIRGRILDDGVMPSYKAYVCQDTLRLKGCPFEFPCYAFNSTYSSKGLIDSDSVYTLDSRNKFYVQKNKYTVRLYENHENYRIILGDDETKYYYFITEMDDITYPGMFIVSLKIDEKHPNDDGFYAYNSTDIDFSDIVVRDNGSVVEEPKIICDDYFKVGKEVEIKCSKPVQQWEIDTTYMQIVETKEISIIVLPVNDGLTSVELTDVDGITIDKNIIVKG